MVERLIHQAVAVITEKLRRPVQDAQTAAPVNGARHRGGQTVTFPGQGDLRPDFLPVAHAREPAGNPVMALKYPPVRGSPQALP